MTDRCFDVEKIPGDDLLYMAVHKQFIHPTTRAALIGAFRNRPAGSSGMSCDWSKYSTVAETKARLGEPSNYGVVKMVTADVRKISIYKVRHDPICTNQAHSQVFGPKSVKEVSSKEQKLIVQQACNRLMALAKEAAPLDGDPAPAAQTDEGANTPPG